MAINKVTITAINLQSSIQAEVNKIKEVIVDKATVVVGLPYWREIDSDGCNWDISSIKGWEGYKTDITRIVRQHMAKYNLPNS